MKSGRISGLYVILDPNFLKGISEVEAAEAMIRGGARVIQWRDKTRDKGEQLPIVKEVNRICAASGVTSIVNDHVDLALASGADGVHLGQKDLPLVEARALMPEGAVIGVSTATVEEARKAEADGAYYIAVGAIYPTTSKAVTRPAGLVTLESVSGKVSVPVVAIGGINADNVGPVVEAGADSVCVISAVLSATDIEAAARDLSSKIRASGRRRHAG